MKIAVPREDRRRRAPRRADAGRGRGAGEERPRGAGRDRRRARARSTPTRPSRRPARAIVADAAALYGQADVVLKVQKPTLAEVDRLREGTVLVAFLQALTSPDLVQRLAARRITSFGMEGIPRISRAQKMDALSSQANIAGYKAVLIAAESLPKFFPMLMTAAGTVFAAARAGHRRRRRRPAGDRHGAPARRAGVGLRRARRR